jgi:hypothetical protein
MLTCGLLVFALSLGAVSWPILEHLQETVETLSSARVSFYKPYTYFAAVAWCNPAQTIAWNCGCKYEAEILTRKLIHENAYQRNVMLDLALFLSRPVGMARRRSFGTSGTIRRFR